MSEHDESTKTVVCQHVHGNRYETPVDQLQWRPAAYGIVVKVRKVLLLKQFGSKYDLPGGGVDIGEDPKDSVVREVNEETGITVARPALLGMESSLFRAAHSDGCSYHSLLLYFKCEYVHGEPWTKLLDEYEKQYVQQAEWVDLDSLENIEIGSTVDFRRYIKQCANR